MGLKLLGEEISLTTMRPWGGWPKLRKLSIIPTLNKKSPTIR